MGRRRAGHGGTLALVVAVALAGCGEPGASPAATGTRAERPHVLLVSLDTLRPDHLGCYGHDRPTSPALDALAAEGVLFRDASSTAPWTLPAHASLLTGAWPRRHGVLDVDDRLGRSQPTLATRLQQLGYHTGAIVNSHYLGRRHGLARGFTDFERVSEFAEPGGGGGPTANRAGFIVDRALRWLRRRDEGPWFLFLHFYDAHTDFTPAEVWRERLVGPYDGDLDGSTAGLLALRASGETLAAGDARHLRELYDAEIRQLDAALARLFAFLEDAGLAERTLLVVTSDHGEEFGERGGVLHGRTQFQELLAVPLVARGPGLPAGLVVDEPVSLVDVVPTLLGRVGSPDGDELDGLDLAPLWERPGARLPERLLFGEADHNNAEPDVRRMVRLGRYKLCHDRLSGQRSLYDLAADPGETRDVAAEHAELADRLHQALRRHLAGASSAEPVEDPLDEQTRAELEALGYLR